MEPKKGKKEKGRRVEVRKVRAHAGLIDIYIGKVSLVDFKGNLLADAYAGEAEKMAQNSKETKECVDRADRKAWLIQERIIAINIEVVRDEGLSQIDKEMRR